MTEPRPLTIAELDRAENGVRTWCPLSEELSLRLIAQARRALTSEENVDCHATEVIQKVQQLVKDKYAGDYMKAFAAYDLDHNGKLGHKDVSKLLEDCGIGNWLTRGVWATGVINELDLDHDGAVSIAELTAAFIKQMAFPAK